MGAIISTTDLAAAAGVSRQMISLWSREGLEEYAKQGRGKWDRAKALDWIRERREDAVAATGHDSEQNATLTASRIAYYDSKTAYQNIMNARVEGVLVYRDTARQAVNSYAAEQIADVDAWSRDTSDEAARALQAQGLTSAQIVAVKLEVANGFKRRQGALARRVHDVLGTVEDVGASRIRLSR